MGTCLSAETETEKTETEAPAKEEMADDEQAKKIQRKMSKRRGSVSAESAMYVKDEEDKPARVIPKSEDAKARIRVAMDSCVLFSEAEEADLAKIVDAMEEKTVNSGETIIFEGQEGDFFYVIESGVFAALIEGQTVFTYDGKGAFGELALMYNCPRAATVTAQTDGTLWALDRMTFRSIIMISNMKKRERFEEILAKVKVFESIPATSKSLIADVLKSQTVEEGSTLYTAGDSTKDALFYIIEAGTVTLKSGEEERELSVGDAFGHEELASHEETRKWTAVAKSETAVLIMQGDSFIRLLGDENIF